MRSKVPMFLSVVLVGCQSAWDRHDESLYVAMRDPSPATVAAHSEVVLEIIENAQARQSRPPAGMSAEYAYYLAKLGRLGEARHYLELEAKHYPESKTFLAVFERFLAGVTPLSVESKEPAK